METPKRPAPGTVLVMRNSRTDEFDPEVAQVCGCRAEAQDWIESQLAEEPGDLYMMCPIVTVEWAKVTPQRRYRNGRRWGTRYVS